MFIPEKERVRRIKEIAKLLVETTEAIENGELCLFNVMSFIQAQAVRIKQLTE